MLRGSERPLGHLQHLLVQVYQPYFTFSDNSLFSIMNTSFLLGSLNISLYDTNVNINLLIFDKFILNSSTKKLRSQSFLCPKLFSEAFSLSRNYSIVIVYSLRNTSPACRVLLYSLCSRLPSKVVRSHLPYHGSMQINGAPLPAGDHRPNNGTSKLKVTYGFLSGVHRLTAEA